MNDIPTTETNTLADEIYAAGIRVSEIQMLQHARDLERRLIIARDALKQIQHNPGNMDMEVGFLSGHIATAALNQTAPKL